MSATKLPLRLSTPTTKHYVEKSRLRGGSFPSRGSQFFQPLRDLNVSCGMRHGDCDETIRCVKLGVQQALAILSEKAQPAWLRDADSHITSSPPTSARTWSALERNAGPRRQVLRTAHEGNSRVGTDTSPPQWPLRQCGHFAASFMASHGATRAEPIHCRGRSWNCMESTLCSL